jgi:hypothetical protein
LPSFEVGATKNKRFLSITVLLAAVILVSSLHANFSVTPAANSASSIGREATGPTHTTHPMVPVPPPPVTPAVTSSSASNSICPLAASQCLASLNWGGYAVCTPQPECSGLAAAPGSVTEVQGTWVVPTIVGSPGFYGNFGSPGTSCSDNENTWYDNSDWVGIDGFASSTVEQTGTSSDCYYGQVYYYAWYEFYPANSVTISSITVHPGDTITAQVNCVPGAVFATCTTTITDQRSHQSYTSSPTQVPGAETDSAEWIAESAYYDGFLALTQTTQVQFSDATATIGGVTHTISGWESNANTDVYWLLMVDYNFGVNQETGVATPSTATLAYAKADTSALGRGGDNFNVDWLSSGP